MASGGCCENNLNCFLCVFDVFSVPAMAAANRQWKIKLLMCLFFMSALVRQSLLICVGRRKEKGGREAREAGKQGWEVLGGSSGTWLKQTIMGEKNEERVRYTTLLTTMYLSVCNLNIPPAPGIWHPPFPGGGGFDTKPRKVGNLTVRTQRAKRKC